MDKDSTKSTFFQLFEVINNKSFLKLVRTSKTDKYTKKLTTDKLITLVALAQLDQAKGLRVISSSLHNEELKKSINLDSISHSQLSRKLRDISPDIIQSLFNEMVRRVGSAVGVNRVSEELQLLEEAGDVFNLDQVSRGELTPVFFGSALANFGVAAFLDQFLALAPCPGSRHTNHGMLDPESQEFSGFIFKIQANMNPQHRDRVAFLRVGSGRFERGMSVRHERLGRTITMAQPQHFFAQERAIVDVAYPGDIIGLFDPGYFRIGDTLSEGGSFHYDPLPQFSPEHFVAVSVTDTLKHKQFHKGLQQLAEEGAVQVFRVVNRTEDIVLGFVGRLQFEVFEYRMQSEYGATFNKTPLPYEHARWPSVQNPEMVQRSHTTSLVRDADDRLVMLFPDEFSVRWTQEKNPGIEWFPTSHQLSPESVEVSP